MQGKKIEISYRSIAFAILFPLALWFLWIIKELLFALLIALILMSALKPIAYLLEKRGLNRTASVFIVFFLFILFFAALVSIIIPPIVSETVAFVKNFPKIVEGLPPDIQQYIDVGTLSQYVPTATNNVVSVVGSIFSNFIFVLSTLFFTLYFMLEKNLIEKALTPIRDKKRKQHYITIVTQVERQMAAWFWGEIVLMTVIGTMTYIALSLIGIKYALPLAVLAGLLEVVPNLGPILASIPAVLVGASESLIIGLVVLALYFVIQQIENAVIVPLIMKRAVNVNPILTLISLFVGGKIGGILGVLLSIPLLIIIQTIASEIWKAKQQ
ncbi:MAG: AI-2E family transporter [Patescibacteria group bacterium]